MPRLVSRFHCVLLFALATLPATTAAAQDLTPRAYWPAPDGTKVVGFAYQYSSGDVLVDPSLPVVGVASKIHVTVLSYTQVFGLAGRTANLQLSLPYSWSDTSGFLEGQFVSRSPAGFGDIRARLSVNLVGAPSMDPAGMQQLRANPRPIIGASVAVQIPSGTYDADRLLNVGTNRWAVKPAVGFILPIRPTWLLELDAGVWLFSTNDEFLGTTRRQDPILSTEMHLIKRIRPGFWASFDANFYVGGRTTVGEAIRADLQRNSRLGGTLTFPFRGRHALRANASFGIITKSGGDFFSTSVSYLYGWR